jgi:hypothetical protein
MEKEALMMRKIGFLMVVLLAVALVVPAPAKAAFPERDITLIVPWAAGGGTDTLARTLVKNAKKFFGVNINVQNVTGGTGVIGMNQVARGKADGYTVAMVTFNLSTYRLLGQSELSYRDFDLIALLNRSIAGLTVKADSQFKTLKDLVDYAKANPGVVTVGHSGPAGAWHLAPGANESQRGFLLNHLISEELPGKPGEGSMSNSDPVTGQAAWYDVRVRIYKAEADEPKTTWPQFAAVPAAPGTGTTRSWQAFFAGRGEWKKS